MAESRNLARHATQNRLYQWHTRVFMDAIGDLVERAAPRTLLDAGCGEGFVAAALHARFPGLEITGLDYSAEAVAYARERYGHAARYQVGSVYGLPFERDAFDLVLCSEVLEHLDRPDDAVGELRRVAREHVLITVPREPVFDALARINLKLGIGGDPGHVNFWTRGGFERFIARHFPSAWTGTRLVYNLALADVGRERGGAPVGRD